MTNRYLKLNANWMESEWLIVLSAEARLAWVQLLCYVKTNGIGGRVKAKPIIIFAQQNFMGEESVAQMIRAAKIDGALIEEDGVWIMQNWAVHQGDETNAERQRRFRSKQNDGDSNGCNALRNGSNTEEKRGEERKGDNPLTPKGEVWECLPPEFHLSAKVWAAYRKQLRVKPWLEITWKSQVKKFDGDSERFANAVEYTIAQGWQGLQEPRGGEKPQREVRFGA